MDMDVEAMLDAPFLEKPKEEQAERTERERDEPKSSSHRHDRDARDDERRSRYSSSSRHRRSSRSPRRRSDSRSHRDRSPSRSRSRHSSRRYRSRSPSYGRRRRSRSRDRRRSRSPRRRRDDSAERSERRRRRARSPSPPVPEEMRDRRTIFVTQLAARLTSRELEDFFSQAGRVRDARIISDRNSRRSKGVGYVEFHEEDSVQNALGMSGQKLLGIPVLVQMSEAEKNRYALAAQQNMMGGGQEHVYQRLYVGSIHFSLTEEDLRQIFEPFGPLDFVNLHKDPETGRSKGYAFIQYKNAPDGRQALEKMNGFDLAGRNLKVGLVTDKPGAPAPYTNLDDDDSAGLALNSLSRTELMHKLAARQSDALEQEYKQEMPTPQSVSRPSIPMKASRTIMLNNMFNPEEETEPDWVQDLTADVKQECLQYGEVEHIHVNPDSLGEVYLKFNSVEAGEKALGSLNGRWFGGKQVTAVFVPEAIYNAKFSL
ncbi:hypothetical protein BDB00DRAFT_872052 [Zychaea mexicana]|uniref:uncharacterized protein n=1 Tax=Zychaea mexicana TaxID=64656 RepID=UPI0022FE5520|nr:uncharacterized protein BDB00DRAFT_872052 [Zychaea mexicana]KAI9493809.1 hypothetical protein BDB00DRAFT_872052 [Zychaea mexicana]